MSSKKKAALTRRATGLMALEPRFMFDGAAVADALQTLVVDKDSSLAAPPALVQIERQAQQKIAQFLQTASDEQVFQLLNGDQSSPDAAWSERLAELRELLSRPEAPVQVLLMDKASQFTAVAAFAANGPGDQPTIFVNPYWVGLLGNEDMVGVIVEELGHWMDAVLNPASDTAGDEGQRLADVVMGNNTLTSRAGADSETANDSGWVQVNGVSYEVEFAALNFVNAYEMVYDLDNDTLGKSSAQISTADIDVSERWADKEQNLHYFNASTPLEVVRISDGTNNQNFSGNDVSTISVVVNGTTYYGWISRPIKANGIVRGFYFWTDDRFSTLAAAQADGNQDGDRTVLNNRGFVFVVDQVWFDQQIAATKGATTRAINNTKDGNLGSIWVANVGSSSDRVDSALNSVMTPNSAPSAVNDSAAVNEGSAITKTASNGLLSNDTDPNSDGLTITTFSVGGVSTPVDPTNGGSYSISNVGSITINKDGSYTFTPLTNYSGPVPPVTYTVSDGQGGSATAVLSISVTPLNDPPVAVADTATVTEDKPFNGQLMGNDSDPDGHSIAVQGFSIAGQSGPFTLGTPYTISGVGTLTVNANGTYTFVPVQNYTGAVPVISYTITDGNGGTATSTLTLTMAPANDAPVANPDNADNAAYAVEAGCHVTGNDQNGTALTNSGSDQTGNVLTNDTDSDASATRTVTAVTSESGNAWNGTYVDGRYGRLTIASNGIYTYDITEGNARVNALNVGDVLTEYFTYTITDNAGATASSTVKMVIKGSNDAPVAVNDYDSVIEVGASASNTVGTHYGTTSGSVIANDADVDSTVRVSNIAGESTTTISTSLAGSVNSTSPSDYVSVQVKVTGSNDSTYQTLTSGGSNVLVAALPGQGSNVQLVLTDDQPLLDYITANGSSITIKLVKANSNTVIGTITNVATVAGASSALGATPGSEATMNGEYGTVKIGSDGAYIYNLTSTALNAGQTYVEKFTYTLTDGTCSTTAVLNITVNGTTGLVMDDESATTTEDTTYTSNGSTNTSNNLLTGDSYNTVALTSVTGFSWGGVEGTVGTAMTKAGIGRLTINSDGSYSFEPASNYNGAVPTVLYAASNGNQSGQATLTITITPADDASVLQVDTLTVPEDGSGRGNVLANDSDVDSTLTVASYTWNNGSSNISGTIGSATSITLGGVTAGSLTLNADGSYTFTPASNWNGTVPVITYTTNTGLTSTLAITVTPINDAPTLDLDANNGSGAAGNDFARTYTNGAAGVSVSDVDTLISDIDDVNMESATVVLLNPQSGDALNVGALPAGISYTVSTSVGVVTVSLSGSDTLANYQAAIQAITFSSTGFSTADRLVSVKVNDGNADSNTAYTTITVSPDARAVTALGTVVNEASPFVMFEVAGAEGQWVSLELGTTGVGDGYAVSGADFLPNLEYFNGSAWVGYSGGLVQIPDVSANNGKMLVRTAVLQDGVFETTSAGYESLKLTVYNAAGVANAVTGAVDTLAEGMAQIRDDGQGSIFLGNNNGSGNTLSPNSQGDTDPNGPDYPAYLDDDRPILVNSIGVNEASPTGVFTVTGTAGQTVRFALIDRTATAENGTAPVATDGTEDYGPGLQIWNGASWVSYTAATDYTLTSATTYIRTAIVDDDPFEGQHNFLLGVTRQAAAATVYGTGSIYDDGTGSYWIGDATAPASNSDLTTNNITLDDDRAITISSPLVNEASDYVVFTLTGNSGQTVSLQLQDDSNNGLVSGKANILENQILKIWNGLDWVNYDATNLPTFNAAGKIFVRVDIIAEQDAPYEGGETFKLNATLTGTSTVVAGEATIIDDGTGVKYPGTFTNGTPTTDNTSLEDDRVANLSVIGGRYNEGSPRAVFTVNASPGLLLTLDVLNVADTGKAPSGGNEGKPDDSLDSAPIYYSLDGGATWQLYNNGTPITAGNVPVLVAVDIANEQDNVYEGEEQFKLLVTSGSLTASAFGTIVDDGTGTVTQPITNLSTNETGANNPAAPKDDDRPFAVNDSLNVTLGGQVAANIITSNDGPAATQLVIQSINYVDSIGAAQTRTWAQMSNTSRQGYDKQVALADGTLYLRQDGQSLYEHAGRRFMVTATNATGLLEYNATGTANGWTTVALNSSVIVSLQDIQDGRLRYTPNPGANATQDLAAQVTELDWRTDNFNYTVTDAAGLATASATVTYTVTGGTQVSFQNPIALPVDADVDGISTQVESVLANRARGLSGVQSTTYTLTAGNLVNTGQSGQSSMSVGPEFDGDLNIDQPVSIGDGYQNAVTTFAWINNTYFAAANADPFASNLDPSIVTLVAEDTATSRGVPDPALQLRDVVVSALTPQQLTGLESLFRFTPNWSPMGFSAEIRDNSVANIDHDPSRTGAQWRFTLDISRTGETTDTFMGFVKWIDQNTIDAYAQAGLPLLDLDGNPITQVGWVDFTQRTPGGDGVAIGNANGNILSLTYTITDNAFGDNNLAVGRITDPGMPVFLAREITVSDVGDISEGQSANFLVTINAPRLLPTTISLDVQDVAGGTDALNGLPLDYSDSLEVYYIDGSAQRHNLQVVNGQIVLPALVTEFHVVVNSVQDTLYEGSEAFSLVATLAGGDADDGQATIVDDGRMINGVQSDDDRPLTVDDVTVNEGSDWAVFDVQGAAGQRVKLTLTEGSAKDGVGDVADYGPAVEYWNGSGWQSYTGGFVQIPQGGNSLLVRVAVVSDADNEGDHDFTLKAENTGGGFDTAIGTINDQGQGVIFRFGPNNGPMTGTSTDNLDDDRPRPPEPAPAKPAALPLPPAPEPAPLPVVPAAAPAQVFASLLSLHTPTPIAPLADAITSGSGYQIPVSDTAAPGLSLYQGVTDQVIQSTDVATKVSLPFDAFIHSSKDAVIKLQAKLANDSALPSWVQFDPVSGVFEVTPPKNFKGKLDLKVVARDDDGREAVALFQMFIGEQQATEKPQSRSSFTEKLRMAGNRPISLVRVVDSGAHKIHASSDRAVKVRAG